MSQCVFSPIAKTNEQPKPIGEPVWWLHRPRGGYGYVQRVPGWIVARTARRVIVEVVKNGGGTVRRRIRPGNVEPRDEVRLTKAGATLLQEVAQ